MSKRSAPGSHWLALFHCRFLGCTNSHGTVFDRAWRFGARHEAVRKLMNTFKVDGLTRALTRQLYIPYFLCFSFGFIGFLSFCLFFLGCTIKREISYCLFGGPPGVRSAPREVAESLEVSVVRFFP